MTQSHFSLMWESYRSNICTGFSSLQHNGEFVDMTLAADGHIVKVHQVLMALSSPYLKELISSVPCQHPVIFLNNISHATLCLILEYVYTGEVLVPSKNLPSFIEAAKALHIKGLQHVATDAAEESIKNVNLDDTNTGNTNRKSKTYEQISTPSPAKIYLNQKLDPLSSKMAPSTSNDDNYFEDHDTDISDTKDGVDNKLQDNSGQNSSLKDKSKLQFTLSIRGSLQVILNRYMYNLHCTKTCGERRWRCIDYRNKPKNRCLAFIVTDNNTVKKRANLHNHPFHDKKILAKIKKNAVFSAIDQVKVDQESEPKADNIVKTSPKPEEQNVTKDYKGVKKK